MEGANRKIGYCAWYHLRGSEKDLTAIQEVAAARLMEIRFEVQRHLQAPGHQALQVARASAARSAAGSSRRQRAARCHPR